VKQKENGRVLRAAFCPTAPHRLAVVSGTKVGLWKLNKDGGAVADGTLSKFKDLTQCVSWRSDGKLLLAGEASGTCAVIDAESKNVLRRLRGHTDAVTCASFATADKSRAATGGRDGKLRIWDVSTCELLQTVDAHSDCMKVLTSGPGGPDGWITAGHDGRVKLWDLRMSSQANEDGAASSAPSCVLNVDHGHPVEDGCAFPGATMFVSSGGPEVKVWDLTAGRAIQAQNGAHSKAVTAVSLNSNASVLLTASFDGLAKVYHAATLEHLWTYRLPAPATCVTWRADDKVFAVGLDDGTWQVRQLKSGPVVEDYEAPGTGMEDLLLPDTQGPERAAAAARVLAKPDFRKREGHLRGEDAEADSGDEIVDGAGERPRKRRESQLDYFFRKFEYRKAVEFMVLPSTQPAMGFAVVDELLQRGALEAALTELGEALCLSTLRWLLKVFGTGDPLQHRLFHEALHTLLDCNRCLQPPSTPELVEVVDRLDNKVAQEMKIQEALMETGGILKTVTAL